MPGIIDCVAITSSQGTTSLRRSQMMGIGGLPLIEPEATTATPNTPQEHKRAGSLPPFLLPDALRRSKHAGGWQDKKQRNRGSVR